MLENSEKLSIGENRTQLHRIALKARRILYVSLDRLHARVDADYKEGMPINTNSDNLTVEEICAIIEICDKLQGYIAPVGTYEVYDS